MADEATAAQGDTATAEATTASTQAPQEEASQTEAQPTEATTTQPEAKAEDTAGKTEAKEDKPGRGLLGEADDSGAPESYEDFKFPEGVDVGAEDQEALKALAKEHGFTQDEAQKSVQFSRSIVEQIAAEEQKALEQFREENKKAWESNPDHDKLTVFAEQGVKKLGKDVESYLAENGYLHDAKILSILAEVGRLSSEATHVAGADGAPQGAGQFYNKSPELYS